MDMQKEVRSFESEFPAPETIQFNERFGFYESVDSVEDARHQNILWKGWLACAKASAVPDGFKVVPVNYECAWCGCTELGGFSDEAMIEAQEQGQ